MDKDTERERLLGEINANVRNIAHNLRTHIDRFESHAKDDNDSFRSLKESIIRLTIVAVILITVVLGPNVISAFVK